jgi:hypothetical protein
MCYHLVTDGRTVTIPSIIRVLMPVPLVIKTSYTNLPGVTFAVFAEFIDMVICPADASVIDTVKLIAVFE